MRERFTEMVRREADHARAGREARIVVKVNGLEDPSMVEELYRASIAGVEIDLIVRDICRLRPGIEGVSENIAVHSIVGRFLEHARIFYFENGGRPEWYIGSADWMTRNLDHRVEAVTPVEDTRLRRQLRFILEATLRDNRRRWEMHPDGSYEQASPGDEPVRDIQNILMRATERALDRGYGPGMAVDSPSTDGDLLIEPAASEDAADPDDGDAADPDDGDAADPDDGDAADPDDGDAADTHGT
jgi:polyphosphate kinase